MGGKWLPHGKQIQARDIETIVGVHFKDLREFINLCNSVAWTQQGSDATSVPSFTERYEVADGGVDAEWIAFQVGATRHVPCHLLVTGWNVYQYKQRDILANGRDECFKSLKSGVSGALHGIFSRTGKRPQGFVLFTNIDLSHETQAHTSDGKKTQAWKKELRESILKDYDEPGSVGVEIVGAAELAAMLNDLPHLRSAYFCRSDFITRDEAWTEHTFTAFPPGTVQLTGRDHDLKSLQWALENPEVRVIVISGQVSVGKTRLVLEATANLSMDTIVARNPRSVRPGDLSDLLSEHHLTIVFVPEYEPEKSENLIDYAIAQKGLKLVVEVASPENLVLPWFGRDERVVPFQIRTLSSGDSTALLKAAGAKFESGVEQWVLDKTSGNPGLLLMATHASSELTGHASSFSNSVVESMTKTIRRDLGIDSLETLRFLSLFDPIPLHGIDTKSIQVIAGTLGIPKDIHKRVQGDVAVFRERGLVRGGERYAVVEPCLLANGLVTQIIGRAGNDFWEAFVRLSPYIQLSLLRRLRQVGAEEIGGFWDRLFGPEGPFADFKLSVGHLELLLAVATQVPVSVAEKMLTKLKSLNPESRRNCIQGIGLQLIWLLEYFLILPDVAETSLRCILLLAEVDDTRENHRPNPKADFRELFHPLHRQVALSLEKRYTLLTEYVKRSNPDWLRLLALEALQTALRHRIAYSVRTIPGPMPALRSDAISITEAFSYQDKLYDLLLEIARSQDPIVSPSASESFPEMIAEMAFSGRGEEAIKRFSVALDSVLGNKLNVPPANLASELERVRGHFCETGKKMEAADRQVFEQWITEMDALIRRLDKVDAFGFRLRRWSGRWTSEDRETVSDGTGGVRLRCDTELRKLAEEASVSSDLLTADQLKWLSSKEAEKAGRFFRLLGSVDTGRKWLSVIEEQGCSESGLLAFEEYFAGWSRIDHVSAAERLDHLNEEKRVHHAARVFATIFLGPSSGGIERITQLSVEPEIEALIRNHPTCLAQWSDELSSQECLQLLGLIAGSAYDNPMKVIEFLSLWLHSERDMEGPLLDFAERCILGVQRSYGDDYACDHVASRLAQQDTERGFDLLQKLLGRSGAGSLWNPIDRHSHRRFWNTLRSVDKRRVIAIVLAAARSHPALAWSAREVLNQIEDESILVSFAAESEEMAETVCKCITAGRPGFWPIATQIIERHSESDTVRSALSTDRIFQRPVIGSYLHEYLDKKRIEVEQLLTDPSIPEAVRPWLKELISDLRQRVRESRTKETDYDVHPSTHLPEPV